MTGWKHMPAYACQKRRGQKYLPTGNGTGRLDWGKGQEGDEPLGSPRMRFEGQA